MPLTELLLYRRMCRWPCLAAAAAAADMLFMLHAVKGVAEMFLAEKDGTPSDLNRPTKLDLAQLQAKAGYSSSADASDSVELEIAAVTAFYDPKARRYAVLWSTTSSTPDVSPPVFLAVSQGRNPLGDWSVWALDLRPSIAKGLDFCQDHPASAYVFEYPQVHACLCWFVWLGGWWQLGHRTFGRAVRGMQLTLTDRTATVVRWQRPCVHPACFKFEGIPACPGLTACCPLGVPAGVL